MESGLRQRFAVLGAVLGLITVHGCQSALPSRGLFALPQDFPISAQAGDGTAPREVKLGASLNTVPNKRTCAGARPATLPATMVAPATSTIGNPVVSSPIRCDPPALQASGIVGESATRKAESVDSKRPSAQKTAEKSERLTPVAQGAVRREGFAATRVADVQPVVYQDPELPSPRRNDVPSPLPSSHHAAGKADRQGSPEQLPASLPSPTDGSTTCMGSVDSDSRFARRCGHTLVGSLHPNVPGHPLPKEQQLVNMPPYVIETPDILLVESARSLPDQRIEGEHLVRMDGTISLGIYGSVKVAGLTVDEAREAVSRHLARFIREPQVNLDVFAYNSKFYYIISDGAGYGEQVVQLAFTGNETVLSAISRIGGIPAVGSKKKIWLARPSMTDEKCSHILDVDWIAITQCGQTATNYQVFPGDRIYIQSDRLLALDGLLAKIISPIERVLGVSILGAVTVQQYQRMGRNGGGGGGLIGGF